MQTTLSHLTMPQQAQLTVLLSSIIKSVQPDKIICYGYHIDSRQHWRPLLNESMNQETITYYLLVIPHSSDLRPAAQLLDTLDKVNIPYAAASCIIHKQEAVNLAIENGSRFFTSLYHHAVLLYDVAVDQLAIPQAAYHLNAWLTAATVQWNRLYTRANSFYGGAAYYQSMSECGQSVFCLHQSVEQMAMAVLKSITGYKADTHNLSRLFVLLEQTGLSAYLVFPNNTPEEKALFQTLKNAYSASRYQDDYVISAEVAGILYRRVGELLKQAEAFYLRVTKNWQSAVDSELRYPLSIAFLNTLDSAS